MSFITLRSVTKTYKLGEHEVTPLRDVDLDIERNEFLVLFGPSGSGKSTLLNLVSGIDSPDKGQIHVDGVDLKSLSRSRAADWRSRNVGYVFQDYSLVPVLTAYENVEIPLWLFPMNRADRHRRVSLALDATGLSDRGHHLPRQLSGGQQQRVAIARAIVTDPALLVADEPTGNLDEQSAGEVLTLLRRLNRERGKTIIMVTHDPRAMTIGTRALRLDKGRFEDAKEVTS